MERLYAADHVPQFVLDFGAVYLLTELCCGSAGRVCDCVSYFAVILLVLEASVI